MSEQTPPQKPRCRFDLFVRLRPGIPSRFRDQQRTWCYRGDRFTDSESKMIRNLLNLVKNKFAEHDLVELYDNDHPPGSEYRIVLKILEGIILVNRLDQYQDLLINFALPDFLK